MFRKLIQRAADGEYCTLAQECQRTADLFPEGGMGREFSELASHWRQLAERTSSASRAAARQLPSVNGSAGLAALLIGSIGLMGSVGSVAFVMWLATVVAV